MNVQTQELFHNVVDLTLAERRQYFADHGVDEQTRREVEALLAFDSGASGFLQRDIGWAASLALAQIEATGRLCGPYRLLDLIGRGGMGAVYLAERVDGEVKQRVAIKLLSAGSDDPQRRERFLQERQILASLAHPNIARMLDAGHLDNGQPFLAMEFVNGEAIDVFAAKLTVRQKIFLFIKVCGAVGYMHRNLVVHRDLKPSNILVTAEGEPKLLDFGIAKILDLATDTTMTVSRMLTPDYASPEQITGGRVTTGTDIYSMGAVLYRLLTGKPPREFEENSPEGIVSAISKGEVTQPSKLAPELRGDLEGILLKALSKDPQERYATAVQFAEDLEAFLESRPVRARSGNSWYRTRKFLRRYRVPLTASALVIASLTAGLYVANRERAIAQQRFLEVRQLSSKLFDIDVQVRQLPGSTKARQLIVDTSLEYLRRLRADVRTDPTLALEVGNAYMRVARVQGVPTSANLGQMDQAEQNLRVAEGFIQSVLVSQPENRTALLRSAQIAHDRMVLARLSGRRDEALVLARKSAESLEKFHAGKGDTAEAPAILNTYLNVADQYRAAQQYDDALRLCDRASDLARTFGRRSELGNFLWVSAQTFRDRGELDEALKKIRDSVSLLDPGPGNMEQGQTHNFVLALTYQGRILGQDNGVSLGRSEEAVASLERAFRIADGFVHQDPNDQGTRGTLAMAGISMADILRHSDARRALAVYDHTLRHLAEVKNNANLQRYEVNVLAGSSYPLRRLGRSAEARQRLDTAFERLRQLKFYPAEKIDPGSEADEALSALADHEAETGNVPRAIEIYQELLSRIASSGAKPETKLRDAVDLSHIWASMAVLHRRSGRADLAVALEVRRIELWQQWDRKLPNNRFVLRQIAAKPAPQGFRENPSDQN